MNSNLKCQQKFITAKLAQTSQLVKGWYDYANSSNKLTELTKDALTDDFERLAKQPQFKNHTRCETREDVQWVMDNGGFNFVLTTIDGKGNSQFAGLMIIAKDKQAGIDGYCIMDKLIVNPLHGQGLGKQFESWVIQRLLQNQLVSPDGILFGEIDFDNKGSLHSAYANGRIEIGRYLWVA